MRNGPGLLLRGRSRLLLCLSLPVGLRHEDVGDDVLAVLRPDPDAVAVQLVADVFEPGTRVVMVNDGQGVGVGHGTHRSLTGLGRPRCGHAAGVLGWVPGCGLPRPRLSIGGAGDSCGHGAAPEDSAARRAPRWESVGLTIAPRRPSNRRPISGYFGHRGPMLP